MLSRCVMRAAAVASRVSSTACGRHLRTRASVPVLEVRKVALDEKKLALEAAKQADYKVLEAAKQADYKALEEKKLALEEKKLALEEKTLAQSRGALEMVFGVSRESAQLMNLVAGGAIFYGAAVFSASALMHSSKAEHSMLVNKVESNMKDVGNVRGTLDAALSGAGLRTRGEAPVRGSDASPEHRSVLVWSKYVLGDAIRLLVNKAQLH